MNSHKNNLALVIDYDTIIESNYQYSKSFFDKLDNEMPLQYRNKVSILVHWNPLDKRELYEISEVREYFVKIFNYVDSFFFWLDPYCDFFQLLGFMLFPPKTTYKTIIDDTCYVEANNFSTYISIGFEKLNQFCDEKGISEEPSSLIISKRINEWFPEQSN